MDATDLENRLERIADIFDKLGETLDNLPLDLPLKVKNLIISTILGDKELNRLIDSICVSFL